MSSDAEARVLKALADYRNAKKNQELDRIDAASDRFHEAIVLVEPDRGNELQAIFNALVAARAEEVFQAFAKTAQGFGEAKSAFELGEKMVQEGKKGLFFPTAANELAKIAGALVQLKQTAEKVINEVDDLSEPFNKKDANALIEEAKQSADALKLLLNTLEQMKRVLQD